MKRSSQGAGDIAEQQPLNAEFPGVERGVIHTLLPALFPVQSPADTRIQNPGTHNRKIVLLQLKFAQNGLVFQQHDHLGSGETTGNKFKQTKKAVNHRLLTAL